MKKVKSEKGIITLITLVTVLFMLSFLISSYVIVSNKVKTQKEMMNETKKIYEPTITMEEIYKSYFSNDKIIPIYNAEQLLQIGKIQENVNINGKFYNFTNDENAVYVLMNDIEFIAEDLELQSDWIPIDENEDFLGIFDWNGYTVEATKLNGITKLYKQLPSTYKAIIKGLDEEVSVVSYRDLEELSADIKIAADKGKVSTVLKETINETETIAIIPVGYEVSTIDEEDSISEGLVVYDGTIDNRNNEFVWIPADGVFNESYTSGDNVEPISLIATDSNTKEKYDSQVTLNYYYGSGFYTFDSGDTYQNNLNNKFAFKAHYEEMRTSVNKYKGFYIGRYETTIDGSNVGSKYNTTVLTADKTLEETNNNACRWWGLYDLQRRASVAKNGQIVQTNMVWGRQWEAMLTFLGTTKSNELISGTQSGVLKSGQAIYTDNKKDVLNNIYDLRRNVRDYTAESNLKYYRVLRGRLLLQ